MPGTSNVDDADPFACCSMTTPDDEPTPAEEMPDLLAALQESVDRVRGRARGRTPVDPEVRAAVPVTFDPSSDDPIKIGHHPAGQTVEQALAYVDDTVELRTPTERALARGYRALQAAYGESQRRMHDQDAELLVVRDAAATASEQRDEVNGDLVRLAMQVGVVADLWRKIHPETPQGKALRSTLFTSFPYDLVGELDELAERV